MHPLQFCFRLQTKGRQIHTQARAASSDLGQGRGWSPPALLAFPAPSAPSWSAAETAALKKPPEKKRSLPRARWQSGRPCCPRKSEEVAVHSCSALCQLPVTEERPLPPLGWLRSPFESGPCFIKQASDPPSPPVHRDLWPTPPAWGS